MRLLVQKLDLDDTQPVYQIADFERGPSLKLLIYGQAEPDVQFEVDGNPCTPADVPLNTHMLIDEAWMTCAKVSQQQIGIQDVRCFLVRLLTLKARTRAHIIGALDYHSMTLDMEEATLGGWLMYKCMATSRA
jgi:hypothetical protein